MEKYAEENLIEDAERCELHLKSIRDLEGRIDEIKQLSATLSLHKGDVLQFQKIICISRLTACPGSAGDPGNKIKSDCYKLCDRFQQLEERYSSIASQIKTHQSSIKNEKSNSQSVITKPKNNSNEDIDDASVSSSVTTGTECVNFQLLNI